MDANFQVVQVVNLMIYPPTVSSPSSRGSGMDRRNPDCRACPGRDRRGMPTIYAIHGAMVPAICWNSDVFGNLPILVAVEVW